VPVRLTALLAIPGMLLLCLNVVWIGFVIALLTTRFRDVPLIVANVLQVVFFATPILWKANTLGDHPSMAEFNPVYHMIEVIRAPLLGGQPELLSWLVAAAVIVVGSTAATALFRRVSHRIVYWL